MKVFFNLRNTSFLLPGTILMESNTNLFHISFNIKCDFENPNVGYIIS